jgi:hypothetical protein
MAAPARASQGTKKCPIDSFMKLTESGAEKMEARSSTCISEVFFVRCLRFWSAEACSI